MTNTKAKMWKTEIWESDWTFGEVSEWVMDLFQSQPRHLREEHFTDSTRPSQRRLFIWMMHFTVFAAISTTCLYICKNMLQYLWYHYMYLYVFWNLQYVHALEHNICICCNICSLSIPTVAIKLTITICHNMLLQLL